jgi:lipid II:glycine glycyltransferase (peptidoglycan interpeptide bridge formation enzyme)
MQIQQITDKNKWDEFIRAQPFTQFAQSWDWAEFQSGRIGETWRFAVVENGEILAAAKLVKKKLFFGFNYFYCDRGPILKDNIWRSDVASLLLEEGEKIAKKENVIFLRLDPIFDLSLSQLNLVKTIDIQPKKTVILDLARSEAELLGAMHQKTRYNIRLAQKKGVEIVIADKERFEEFWSLMEETRERDVFYLHDKKYYREMIDLPFIKFYFAQFKGRVIAASIIAQFGDMVTYIHGGSSNNNREVMAPFLLQWTAILDAQKQGFRYYDFFGVDEIKWPGVTRFKMGFNPVIYDYSGTHDLVYQNLWYSVYRVLRWLRRMV